MSSKLSKLADVVRMAARSYDAGKRETAIKLIGTVASKLEFPERQKLLAMVESDISHSGIRVHLRSIIVGHGGSSVNSR